ncbi:MAG: formyltetrahydrofolate deformylase, partial [Burkholderiaceae bacterium]
MSQTYVLTLSCPDKAGIVHAVSGHLLGWGGNIEEAAQYNDTHTGLFFMRVQFSCASTGMDAMRESLATFTPAWNMQAALFEKAHRMPTILMVSKQGHCLNDLLFRWKSGLLDIDLRGIISNHRDFYQLAASYNVPFHYVPVTKETKAVAEAKQLAIIEEAGAELVVLARYMQVLSDAMCRALNGKAINIHHR